MDACTIYYNPECSKCRSALELIEGRGIRPTVVNYLETPPGAAELRRLVGLLGGDARVLLRRDEPEYASLGLGDPSLDAATLIDALIAHPHLLQRPVVVSNGKALIGRPPHVVLDIL